MEIKIRPIEIQDNKALALIIRNALAEFGANKPGTVYFDPTTDDLYTLFRKAGSVYYVATIDGKLVGGSGIYPTQNLPEGTCELVKLYLDPAARGTGLGKKLMLESMQWAKENGYHQIYLESMPELAKAVSMYEKLGFKHICAPLGNTGHDGCDIWMLYQL